LDATTTVLGALRSPLLIYAPCIQAKQCRGVHRSLSYNRAEFGVIGTLFEPIAPSRPWGPQNLYKADIREGAAMVIFGLKDKAVINTPYAFKSQLRRYDDSLGNGMMAHFQIGAGFELYLVGLQFIWSFYEGKFGTRMADVLGSHSIAHTMFNSRSAYMSVWSNETRRSDLLGFLRVFDGTDYSKLADKPYAWKAYYDHSTPAEISLQNRNIQMRFFKEKRAEGYHIFEIGKYFLSDNLTPADKIYVKQILHKFLQENFTDPNYLLFPEKTLFVFHVSSDTHMKAYKRSYGAQEVPADSVLEGKLMAGEHILFVDLKTFREKLGFDFPEPGTSDGDADPTPNQ